MKWLKNIFTKKRRNHSSARDIPIKETPMIEEWVAVWHDMASWENGAIVSYTIFYCPQKHKFTVRTRGFRAEEHSFYHSVVLGNFYRLQRGLYRYEPLEIIAQIAEINDVEQMQRERSLSSKLELSIADIERMIQENLDIENYREVARLQKELDKRRGL